MDLPQEIALRVDSRGAGFLLLSASSGFFFFGEHLREAVLKLLLAEEAHAVLDAEFALAHVANWLAILLEHFPDFEEGLAHGR